MYIAASAEKIIPLLEHEYGDGARDKADHIRAIWKADSYEGLYNIEPGLTQLYNMSRFHATHDEIKRLIINNMLNAHGIKLLGVYKTSGEVVEYCNAGDTYIPTIIFIGNRLIVGCWGDMVERNQIEERNF